MSKSRPTSWYPHHPADFMASTQDLSLEEEGAYRRLLDYHFQHGFVPADARRLQTILKASPHKTKKIWKIISRFFFQKGDKFFNKRMLEEIERSACISKKRSEAAKKKWDANAYANADASAYTYNSIHITDKHKDQSQSQKTCTADAAQRDDKKEFFDLAIDVLCPTASEGQARGLAGKLLKVVPDPVEAMVCLHTCEGKENPVSYLGAVIRGEAKRAAELSARDRKDQELLEKQLKAYEGWTRPPIGQK